MHNIEDFENGCIHGSDSEAKGKMPGIRGSSIPNYMAKCLVIKFKIL